MIIQLFPASVPPVYLRPSSIYLVMWVTSIHPFTVICLLTYFTRIDFCNIIKFLWRRKWRQMFTLGTMQIVGYFSYIWYD